MRSRTSRGVPEWSGGEELYIGSQVSAIGKVSGSPVVYRDHRKGPGGPPGGATYPGGTHGLKVEGNQTLVGWAPPMGLHPCASPLYIGVEGDYFLPSKFIGALAKVGGKKSHPYLSPPIVIPPF